MDQDERREGYTGLVNDTTRVPGLNGVEGRVDGAEDDHSGLRLDGTGSATLRNTHTARNSALRRRRHRPNTTPSCGNESAGRIGRDCLRDAVRARDAATC